VDQVKIGDLVEWESGVGGRAKLLKRGKVVAVIPANVAPLVEHTSSGGITHRMGGQLPRTHESYVVWVPSRSCEGAGRLHWPRVKHLRLA
jgi:hypothetical protein